MAWHNKPIQPVTYTFRHFQKLFNLFLVLYVMFLKFDQGGASWLAFGERKIIPQSFRRARICKFLRQKHCFLQLRKYWLFLAVIVLVML